MALNQGPFGTYTDVVNVQTAAEKTELKALLDEFVDQCIPDAAENDGAGETSSLSPDFARITRDMRALLRGEIVGLKAAIDAAPEV